MTAAAESYVDLQIASDAADIPDAATIERWVRAVLADSDVRGEVSIRVVDREEMRILNRDYRDKDRPTNVLSFPAGDVAGLPPDAGRPLGDIVVCAPVVADEAAEQGKRPADHWAHMLVHGTLHLLGHDHIEEAEAESMEALERRLLGAGGVADPYAAR